MRKVWLLCVSLSALLGILMFPAGVALGQVPAEEAAVPQESGGGEAEGQAEAAPGGGLGGALLQAKAAADAMQQQLREKRLAVLKQLEAGEIDANSALEALDKLPAPPGRFKGDAGGDAWLMVQVRQNDENEFQLMVPLSVVRWLISEGPKLLPKEMREELTEEAGYDITQIDLSGLIMALDALTHVTAPTPLFLVKNQRQEVVVTVLPQAPGSGK